MTYEKIWQEMDERLLKDVHKAQRRRELAGKISSHCRGVKENGRWAHLRDLNARGTHLDDAVYQKLIATYMNRDEPYAHWKSYVRDALCRIGNRTMKEEEYRILEDVEGKKLVDYRLDDRLRELEKKLNSEREPSGNVTWSDGPFFYVHTPRTKEDPFHEGYQ